LHNWDWAGAEDEYRRAISLNQNDADAHYEFARFLDDLGRLDEGWTEQLRAQELNPNPDHLPWATNLAEALERRGQYDQAIGLLAKVLESNPNDGQTHLNLSQSYEQTGRYKEAIAELGRTCVLYGHPEIATRLEHAFDVSGYQGAIRQWAHEIEHLQATKQAEILRPPPPHETAAIALSSTRQPRLVLIPTCSARLADRSVRVASFRDRGCLGPRVELLEFDLDSYLPFAPGKELCHGSKWHSGVGCALNLRGIGSIENVEELEKRFDVGMFSQLKAS